MPTQFDSSSPPPFQFSAFSARSFMLGTLAAFVGVASSFAVVLQGLNAAGATTGQAASGLMALSVSMGLCAVLLSIRSRMPISVAWSTPGAAFLASTSLDGGFGVAVGAFLICGVLLMLSGLIPWLGRAVGRIPLSLASAMLAGILFTLCLAPARAIAETPVHGLLLLVAWAVGGLIHRLFAIPAALLAFVAMTLTGSDLSALGNTEVEWMAAEWVTPVFTWQGFISIALPLFVVTTASQNIPGIAVLRSFGYTPDPGRLFATTGLFSVFSAPFGGHAVNLAAITAALCAGEEAHEDRHRRYWSSIINGLWYVLFGVAAGVVTLFVSLAPAQLLESVAGLALIGSFATAVVAAFSPERSREAAAVTFFITASGLSFGGISGAFWGLVAGMAVYGLNQLRGSKR